MNVAIENSTLVATVVLENRGDATPGVDADSVTKALFLHRYSRNWNNANDLGGRGNEEPYPFAIGRAPSHDPAKAVFDFNRPHRWSDAPQFGPVGPGEELELRFLFPLAEDELRYFHFSFMLDSYYTGCIGELVPETYSSWDEEESACPGTYDHCGYPWEVHKFDLDGYPVPREYMRHMECVPRPVEARYYGDPDDRGVPDTPRRFV